MANFLSAKGAKSTALFGESTIRFSVAKVSGTPYFLGVEEFINRTDNSLKYALRVSYDLVNWSDRYIIPGTRASDWNHGLLHFPIFFNKNGWTNTEIDLNF